MSSTYRRSEVRSNLEMKIIVTTSPFRALTSCPGFEPLRMSSTYERPELGSNTGTEDQSNYFSVPCTNLTLWVRTPVYELTYERLELGSNPATEDRK